MLLLLLVDVVVVDAWLLLVLVLVLLVVVVVVVAVVSTLLLLLLPRCKAGITFLLESRSRLEATELIVKSSFSEAGLGVAEAMMGRIMGVLSSLLFLWGVVLVVVVVVVAEEEEGGGSLALLSSSVIGGEVVSLFSLFSVFIICSPSLLILSSPSSSS